jgi:hypothetical protein
MEKSIFIEFMGDSPTMRVIDYMVPLGDIDCTISDVARNAHVGRATLYRIWDDLIKRKTIIFTRNIGKAKLYKLNKANKAVQKLIEIEDMLIRDELRMRIKKKSNGRSMAEAHV